MLTPAQVEYAKTQNSHIDSYVDEVYLYMCYSTEAGVFVVKIIDNIEYYQESFFISYECLVVLNNRRWPRDRLVKRVALEDGTISESIGSYFTNRITKLVDIFHKGDYTVVKWINIRNGIIYHKLHKHSNRMLLTRLDSNTSIVVPNDPKLFKKLYRPYIVEMK